jgi:hypothetical protein
MATARNTASDDRLAVGAGLVDAHAAAFYAPPGSANAGITSLSDGSGSLDGSRGHVVVATRCKASDGSTSTCAVKGNSTAEQKAWDGNDYGNSTWDRSSWRSSQWYGGSWYGGSWYGSSWYGSSWYGSSWYGSSWYSTNYGTAILGSSWYGAWD